MTFSTMEILGMIGIGVFIAVLVGGYMIISRRKKWM
jgi:hypothetical protein